MSFFYLNLTMQLFNSMSILKKINSSKYFFYNRDWGSGEVVQGGLLNDLWLVRYLSCELIFNFHVGVCFFTIIASFRKIHKIYTS